MELLVNTKSKGDFFLNKKRSDRSFFSFYFYQVFQTKFLLMSTIATENFIAVLDSCHSGGGKRGNFKIRVITGKNDYPSIEELEYQKQWLAKLGMTQTEYIEKRKKDRGVGEKLPTELE